MLAIYLFECSLEFCMVNLVAFEYNMYALNLSNGPSLMLIVLEAPLLGR